MPVLSNAKHERFAQEVAKGKSASEAFVLAGYSKNDGNAVRLKGNEKVSSRIEEILKGAAQKAGVTVERVLEEYAKIAFADITEAVDWGDAISITNAETGETTIGNGIAIIAAKDLPKHIRGAISEVKQTKEGIAIKFHSKTAALDALGKHLGMFKERVEHSGPGGGPIETVAMSDRDRAKALAALVAKAKSGGTSAQ